MASTFLDRGRHSLIEMMIAAGAVADAEEAADLIAGYQVTVNDQHLHVTDPLFDLINDSITIRVAGVEDAYVIEPLVPE